MPYKWVGREQSLSRIHPLWSDSQEEIQWKLTCTILLIPDSFLTADVHRVLKQGVALTFSCGRHSTGTGKHKVRVSHWACETGHIPDSKGNVKLHMLCYRSTSSKKKKKNHSSTQISAKAVITLAGEFWLPGCSLSAKPSWVVSSALQVPVLLLLIVTHVLAVFSGIGWVIYTVGLKSKYLTLGNICNNVSLNISKSLKWLSNIVDTIIW